jgi:cytochrome c553
MKHTVFIAAMVTMLGIGGAQAADAQAGSAKATAAGCAACHGANGEGIAPNTKLAGKSEAELAQALEEYKSGKRANALMKSIAGSLSAPDIANLAAFYASKK